MNASATNLHTAAFIVTSLVLTSIADTAFARRQSREGFNFGTTVRMLSGNDRTTAGEGSDRDTKAKSHGQSVNPYVGYAFEYLNIGLVYSASTEESQAVEHGTDGQTRFERNSSLNGQGLSFFMRFMFGGYFFFEGAGGIYQERLSVKTESKSLVAGGTFTGTEDEYEVDGIGPGYHLAAGLELPMGANFFFTSAYQTRMVQLRDHKGGSSLGKKRSSSQERELLFGIAHYVK